MSVHAGRGERYSDSWFVVFRPPDDEGGAALLALESSPRAGEGFWTFDADLVADIDRTVAESL